MLFVLLIVITLVLIVMISAKINTLNESQKRKLYWQMFLCGVLPLLLFKLIPGRFLIFFVVAGVLVPALRVLFVPGALSSGSTSNNNQNNGQNNNTNSNSMSFKEALNILGLDTKLSVRELTEEMVINAHRQLIQKFHPDRGGNDYLAAKINEAKDILISAIRG